MSDIDNLIATLDSQLETIVKGLEEGTVTLERLRKENTAMRLLLEEVRESIDGFIDIKDGANGPLPNWAMSLTQEIDDLIGKD